MKWSIQQLQKLTQQPLIFDDFLDFSDLAKNVSDIFEIKPVHVKGKITNLGNSRFKVDYTVKAHLVMECALTLEPVDYFFEESYEEIFAQNASEDEFPIEKNTLDLDDAVWSNIIIDKPMVVTRKDAYDILKERGIVLNETIDEE